MSGGSNEFPVVDLSRNDFPVVDLSRDDFPVVDLSNSPPKVVDLSDSPQRGEGGAARDEERGEGGAAKDDGRDLRPCTICHGELPGGQPVTVLECGHVFHSHCASMILVHNGSLCPVCKKEYKFKERSIGGPAGLP